MFIIKNMQNLLEINFCLLKRAKIKMDDFNKYIQYEN